MTTWAFVSDIHGNYRALLRAAEIAQAHGADQFVALGDVIGRGQPQECVAWVRAHAALAVVGNRDLDHAALVGPDDRAWVQSLPRLALTADFAITHGDAALHRAMSSADERRGFRRAYLALAELDRPMWFFGHTHHARAWRKSDADAAPVPLDPSAVSLHAAEPGERYFFNVGTTGRPRGGCGPAAIALYDVGRAEVVSVTLA
jgi:predicted phosphodiesterase